MSLNYAYVSKSNFIAHYGQTVQGVEAGWTNMVRSIVPNHYTKKGEMRIMYTTLRDEDGGIIISSPKGRRLPDGMAALCAQLPSIINEPRVF